MKRTLTLFIAVLLTIGLVVPAALAAPNAAGEEAQKEILPNHVMTWGSITSVDKENSWIEVEQGNDKGAILLHIDKDTRIVDNVTKKPVKLKSLKEGDTIYAWHSPLMTMSLPPQTYAHALVVNIPADMQAGMFFEVEKVEKTENGYRLLNQQQDLFITIPANVKIKVFASNKVIRASAVKPGMKLMAWYNMVATSYPGQTGTNELIAFPYDYAGYVSVDQGAITINGKKLTVKAKTAEDGSWLIPLRDVAKRLGFSVRWNAKSGVLTLKKGKASATFTKGADLFTVNGMEVAGIKPTIMDGRLYVELKALEHFGTIKIAAPQF